jgi:hypothetical protein
VKNEIQPIAITTLHKAREVRHWSPCLHLILAKRQKRSRNITHVQKQNERSGMCRSTWSLCFGMIESDNKHEMLGIT